MTKKELKRFNEVSKKVLKKIASKSELLEFKRLLLIWDNSIDFNFKS